MKKKLPFYYLLLLIYLILWLVFYGTQQQLKAWGMNMAALQGAHLLIWVTTLLTYRITAGSFNHPNPQRSVRAIIGSLLIKFFVIAVGAFVYILYQRKQVNLPALAGGALLYVLYTALETRALLRELQRTHG